MWLFVLFVAQTIRTDMLGRTASIADLSAAMPKLTRRQRKQAAAPEAEVDPSDHPETKLAVISGRGVGTSVPLVGEISLGRGAEATLDINDDYASARHAKLWRDATGSWVVQDLHSTNGTYVNGFRIVDPTRLTTDDVIRIGRTQLQLEA